MLLMWSYTILLDYHILLVMQKVRLFYWTAVNCEQWCEKLGSLFAYHILGSPMKLLTFHIANINGSPLKLPNFLQQ